MFDQHNPLFQKARLFLPQPLQNDLEYLDFCKFPASMHQGPCISHKLSKMPTIFVLPRLRFVFPTETHTIIFIGRCLQSKKDIGLVISSKKKVPCQRDHSLFLVDFHLIEMVYHHQGFHQVWYQGIEATVSVVLEDLTFKISEGSDQNLRQPTGQTQDNFNFGPSLLKF